MSALIDFQHNNEIIENIFMPMSKCVDFNTYYFNDMYYITYKSGLSPEMIIFNKYKSANQIKIGYIDQFVGKYIKHISSINEKQYILKLSQEEFDLIISISKNIGGISLHRMTFTYLYHNEELRSYQKYEYDTKGEIYTMIESYINEHNIINYSEKYV